MGRKSSGPKPKKRKKVTVQLLKREHQGKVTQPYTILDEMIAGPHNHLKDTKIAIAWRLGWRPDADNHLTLGKLRKRGDLDRELDKFDFIVLLNKEAWETLNEAQRKALIDHELCHGQISYDSDGEPKQDDRGRLVCRVKKHDLEEFQAVVDRHGCWTSNLSALAQAAINDQTRPLLKEGETPAASTNGNAWKAAPLADAAITGKIATCLEEAGLTTLGKLSDHMAEKGDWWARELKGIGETAAEKISNLFAAYWKRHPEFCGK